MLDFFVGFMDAIKIPQATLVGNSMGAGLAIGMALEHPAHVARLVLVGGLPQHVIEKLTSPSIKTRLEHQCAVLVHFLRQSTVRWPDDRVRPTRNGA